MRVLCSELLITTPITCKLWQLVSERERKQYISVDLWESPLHLLFVYIFLLIVIILGVESFVSSRMTSLLSKIIIIGSFKPSSTHLSGA